MARFAFRLLTERSDASSSTNPSMPDIQVSKGVTLFPSQNPNSIFTTDITDATDNDN